ncbi:MAG: PEP-CTERM sorting domain-containing protein [Acidobacteria bacterium]|nr:PEP-CTERM sorting domain-containing protein [Acidobacteriota bacterium]
MKRLATNCMMVLGLLLLPIDAQADSIVVGFTNITNDSGIAADIAGQLRLTIYDASEAFSEFGVSILGGQVLFAYTNAVGIASSISEIYIDDGTVVSFDRIINNLGGYTLFTGPGAHPGNLPGGQGLTPPFVATQIFSADAQGNPIVGVDSAADIVGVVYTVNGGLDGLEAALADGSLRVGLHLRSIGSEGDSDSFVDTVPEPSLIILLGIGFGVLGLPLRRRSTRSCQVERDRYRRHSSK